MNVTPVTFYSEGFRLVGDLYAPGDLRLDERRAEIVAGHGDTGVRTFGAKYLFLSHII